MNQSHPNVESTNPNRRTRRRVLAAAATAAALLIPAACADNGTAENKSAQTTQEVEQTTTPEQARGEVASKVFDYASVLMNTKSDVIIKSNLAPNEENLSQTDQYNLMLIKPGETNPTQVLNIFVEPNEADTRDGEIVKVEILNYEKGSLPENPSSGLTVDATQDIPVVSVISPEGGSFDQVELWELKPMQMDQVNEILGLSSDIATDVITADS
jgi:hypothetical protein